ncbi:MAG: LPS export ABC transporter permease LptF [Desulfobacteraceae bacterium]|nr:MAG: LPS export ABC transporter permease LptF [Desulfobacteraceae bacterium]
MIGLNTINRYILKELFAPFLVSLLFLTFVFLMTRIPEVTNMVMNYNANLISVCLLILYTVPKFMEFTIPMSVMIAVLLTFMKMAGDNEILAVKSSGISLYRLMPPVLIFCIIGMALTLWMTLYGSAWGRYATKIKSQEIIQASPDIALQERQFFLDIEDIMIYINEVNIKSRQLRDVIIEDRRTTDMVSISTAPTGHLISNPDSLRYTLRLYNGGINQVDLANGSVNHIRFEHYDIQIDLAAMMNDERDMRKGIKEQNMIELIQYLDTQRDTLPKKWLYEAQMKIHENIAIPVACICLGILAFATGIRSVTNRRSAGFGLGVGFFLIYYMMMATGWAAGETGRLPAAVAMWGPNLIMGTIGIVLLKRNAMR